MKKALIVGGSNGIGLAFTEELTKRYDKVIVVDKVCPQTSHEKIEFLKLNLTCCDFDVFKDIKDIDTLIITAGFGRVSLFETMTQPEIENSFKVNSIAIINIIKAYYDKLISAENFNCAVMGSIAGLVSSPVFSVYAATKAAVNGVTRAMAVDYAPYGIRVNAVLPGLIMSDNIVAGAKAQKDIAAYAEVLKGAQPLPPGQSQDVANAALFLASDMSAYVTGHTLLVDGGARARIKW